LKNNQKELTSELLKLQNQIHSVFSGFKNVYGFPMNTSFINSSRVWDEIRVTDIHLNSDEENELNLTVYVNAYPNKIFSVWVYFAILKPY
jgi:hypothetical protein